MKSGKVFILSGPSGSGKTTLYKKLLRDKSVNRKLGKSISVTTRTRRPGEKQGRDYIFVSQKMFLFKKRAGHFVESQKVFDNYYGTPKKGVKELLRQGKNVLLCIDVKGAKVVNKKISKAVKIFIKTPSLKVLEGRLRRRGSENMKLVDLRLRTARQELKEAKHYEYVIVNKNLENSFKKLRSIFLNEMQS